ncbi:hypothetical protein DPMN_079939 [Dreissena polymorpha]|uniref:Uncharacterized protein n=1 Tax=Dreissena polymorpha TaxID=45954 RepID=A0A9D3YVE7_DREPO|nr:hypothetical protein DPMN_079939 [Dreissena polymorpha]
MAIVIPCIPRKKCPAPDIIGTNLLTMFHDDRTIIMASRVLTRKNATPPWGPWTNRLTKFHDDRTIIVASRVLIRKNAPPPGGHAFKTTETIFKLIQDIIGTNLLTKFHEDRKINVASRLLTRKISLPSGGHVFQPTGIIFELVQNIIWDELLTRFHEDWTINVASRVKCPAPWRPCFSSKHIIETHLLTKFHEDLTINRNAPPPWWHDVFEATKFILELMQDIIGTNLLTKFHENRKINVASRDLTRNKGQNCHKTSQPASQPARIRQSNNQFFPSENLVKNAPPPGHHIFQPTGIIF